MTTKRRAVGIIGSYRKGGTIYAVVSGILSNLESNGLECQTIFLKDYNMEFCTNCRNCLQTPGVNRGECIHKDDIEDILRAIDTADFLIIGSPTNAGNANALTRQFLERCVCFAYWPWGKPAPVLRNTVKNKKSILVSASAAPSLIGKYFNGTLKTLKTLSEYLGANPIGEIWVGSVNTKEIVIPNRIMLQASKLSKKLIEE